MKKLKQNLAFLHNDNYARNATPSPNDGIVLVNNEPLPFNGHSLDVDVCMKTGTNLSPVNMNVITPSNDVASEIASSIVNNLNKDMTNEAAQQLAKEE